MKKNLLIIVIIALTGSSSVFSQMSIGITGGLSTPNDQINNVYNSSKIQSGGSVYDYFRNAADLGFNIGLKLRTSLLPSLVFTGGIAWNRFPETQIKIVDPNDASKTIGALNTVQNIIPISVGLNYYFLQLPPSPANIFGFYATGELQYNIISSTVDYEGVPLNIDTAPSDTRVGVGFGLGVDINLKLLLLNIEAKYSIANFIGRTSGEKSKNYLSLNLGMFFGN
jgi:hypothetical protein